MNWDETAEVLQEFADMVVRDAKRNLATRKKNTSVKSLSNSLEGRVVEFENSLGCEVLALGYYKFVDQGVKGHGVGDFRGRDRFGRFKGEQAPDSEYQFKIPAGNPQGIHRGFKRWLRIKPITPNNPIFDQLGGRDKLTFLMVRSARKYGIAPSYFMTDAIEKNLGFLDEKLEVSVSADIVDFIEETIDDNF